MLHSIVEYYADNAGYRCGYCKSSNGNFSHGIWAHSMTVGDYQDLIDRGWRRSGKYCYKPTMSVTCCPMYTIRTRALELKATKSQKKVLKRFNKYLLGQNVSENQVGGTSRKMSTCSSETDMLEAYGEGAEQFVECTNEPQDINVTDVVKANSEALAGEPNIPGKSIPFPPLDIEKNNNKENSSVASKNNKVGIQTEPCTQNPVQGSSKPKEIKKGTGPDPSKAPHKKAKLLRRERALEKLKEKGIDVSNLNNTNKNKEKQLEDFINELPADVKHKLEIKLVRTTPPSPEWQATSKETFDVYFKYQTVIHNDKPTKCTMSKFLDFLVHSPLLEEHSETGPPSGYGSFHQQYWLDGKIIAVGVIDILPKCVSSVYFFYDPKYMNLTLGTYGALRELTFTRHLHTMCPELKYYYMGYYIHTCTKMRYKGSFGPSDLLCPETYNWFPITDCIPKLEIARYSRLDPNIDNIDENHPKEDDINYIPLLVKGVVMPYKSYKRKHRSGKSYEETLLQYSELVGAKSAKRLILVSA